MLKICWSRLYLQRFDKRIAIYVRFWKLTSIPNYLKSLTRFFIWIKWNQLSKLIIIEIFCCLSCIRLGLYCCIVNARFVDLSHVNLFFNCSTSDKSIYYHIFLLPYSIYSIDALVVICRIPIRIHYYGAVSSCKI